MDTMTYTGVLAVVNCCTCGMTFAMPGDFKQRRRDDHEWFYCPAGHEQHYAGKSDAEKLRDELARKERALVWERSRRDMAQAEAKHMRAVANGHKGAHQRTKNRVAKGVCPCCNRSFVNLAKHMSGQHPDYSTT